MTVLTDEVSRFITFQNENRGATGQEVQKDYWLEGIAPVGANEVEGISGIAAGAATIDLTIASGKYNAIILDGDHSTTASAAGSSADNYAFSVNTSGVTTILDENTGNSQTVDGAAYIVFDSAFRTDGAYESLYIVAGGTDAQIAAMYNAAYGRQPDLPGLEFYAVRIANGEMDLHQAAVYFLASPEFATKYPALTAGAPDNGGTNDQAFITELYGNILHRTPTTAEVTYYVDALQGTLTTSTGAHIAAADRAQLLIYFSVSPENQADISGWLINTSTGYADTGVPVVGVSHT